ncbi:SLAP domain-containing protein [Clostridium estertheticum]|uniref:SLAP domain-containing protein n=1 Tax=Clostridium estertheticum TaxID=238834 RepID=UPI001CF2A24B|nr:SLAP domain-containing protein [Clostridium estertheticum]MCB2306001.1 SLAP domain-containing protein [Clostridium estertheticum]MCB2346524.1 SLAP domain-containing protein [Clostridium estertheticum]MCB2349027.1 SLAP domain-containing protein [Clostridium estertheticum]WAG47667.1 SLAP domain-containing protein [Clostridium estertheticum]
MSNIDTQKVGTDFIVINDKLSGLVTITTEDLSEQNLSDNFIYKVCPNGEILNSGNENKIDEKLKKKAVRNSKEILSDKLIADGFDKIPENLSKLQLAKILEFSENKIVKNNKYSRMFPFSVEKTDNYDLKVILLMYNGSNIESEINKFPFKLKDANDNVLIADLIDINKTIGPYKIGICEVLIEKAQLSEQLPDLTSWTVTFEMA